MWQGPAELFEAFFQFNVSDGPFFAKQLSITGSSASGDAAVTVVEELCLGTPFDSCLSVPETLILFNIEADAQTSFQSTFTPADFLGVRIDIAIDGGLAGMASLTHVTNTFQADIALRLVAGGVLAAPFPGFNPDINGRLGDGVNVNDAPYRTDFPYLADAPSGRDRRHIDPGEPGCTAGAGAPCRQD